VDGRLSLDGEDWQTGPAPTGGCGPPARRARLSGKSNTRAVSSPTKGSTMITYGTGR